MAGAAVDELFAEAARALVAGGDGVEQGRIMHADGVKVGGKFFAFVARGELVVKLPAARVAELIGDGAGLPFDAGKGRPMREWVRLRPATMRECTAYAAEARDFVAGAA